MNTDQKTRNFEVELLQRIAGVTQKTIAEGLNVDPSTVHRIINGESGVKLSNIHQFLSLLGMKVVDANAEVIDKEEVSALRYLAGKAIGDRR